MSSYRTLYVIFLLSGAAGLTYQVIWLRWLSLIFGGTTASVSIVLSSFMLGLALGSWWVGRRLGRTRDPLALYGWLELGIGAFAIVFPLVSAASDGVFTAWVQVDSPPAWSLLVRALLAFSVLVVPTTLMGATLPLMAEYVRRGSLHGRSWKVGLLYAAHALGAALGALAAGFICIELIGVRATSLLAAALNFGVGGWALLVPRNAEAHAGISPVVGRPASTLEGKLALGVLAASGAMALASVALWTRTLESLIGNSSYAFALLLTVYLVGVALGSSLLSLFVKRLDQLPVWLIATQVVAASWIVVAIGLFYVLAEAIAEYGHTIQPIDFLLSTYLKSALILFPLALFSGAAFPIATRILDPDADDAGGAWVAKAYCWNTVGAVTGVAFAGFVIAPNLDFIQSIYVLVVLYGTTAVLASAALLISRTSIAATAAAAIFVTAGGLATLGVVRSSASGRFADHIHEGYPMFEVAYHEPGLQGVTTVLKPRDGREGPAPNPMLLVNGRRMTAKLTATKMMAHLPMLLHPDPQDALVIGFGMGTSYRSALAHGGSVTTVERVGEVFGSFDHFHDDAEVVRSHPRGRMITSDGRGFLKLTRERYDVITIEPPPSIDGAGVNHLYSRDFLELARTRLKEGGIMAHWIPAPHAQASVDDWNTFSMLLRTFAQVFPHRRVIQSDPWIGVHVLGSMRPIEATREQLEGRLGRPAIGADIAEWGGLPEEYFTNFVEPKGAALQGNVIVTDDRPRLEFNLLRGWKAKSQKTVPPVWW